MNSALAVLGALGGLAVFIGSVVTVARGIFRQVNATEENTAALNDLRKSVNELQIKVARLEGRST